MSTSPFKNPEDLVENPKCDVDFSIDISKKMTVPNKIKAVEGLFHDLVEDQITINDNKNTEMMHVPECIRVAGGESHITSHRGPPLEMKLEDKLFGRHVITDDSPLQLSTPPRTLHYEDVLPILAEPIKQLDKALNTPIGNVTNRSENLKLNNTETSLVDYDDPELMSTQNLLQLRRHLVHLSKRVDSLEIENDQRNRRDLIIYALGALYLLFRGLSWFVGNGGGGRNRFTF